MFAVKQLPKQVARTVRDEQRVSDVDLVSFTEEPDPANNLPVSTVLIEYKDGTGDTWKWQQVNEQMKNWVRVEKGYALDEPEAE
jgi:hypothetical protein